ncbi:hypothetical protein D3C85_1280630 [compost metagenome]
MRCIREQFQHHQRTVFSTGLPTPGEFFTGAILGPFKPHFLEVVFECVICLGISQDLQVDHDVHVQSACVRRHYRRPRGYKVSRCESSDQVDRLFPRPESTQQRYEDAFAVLCVLVAVAIKCCGLCHQKPILSLRKCSAISLARPSPRKRSR